MSAQAGLRVARPEALISSHSLPPLEIQDRTYQHTKAPEQCEVISDVEFHPESCASLEHERDGLPLGGSVDFFYPLSHLDTIEQCQGHRGDSQQRDCARSPLRPTK